MTMALYQMPSKAITSMDAESIKLALDALPGNANARQGCPPAMQSLESETNNAIYPPPPTKSIT